MKFFIDTANLEQIQEAYDLGVLDGVTTNPSLMAKEGIKGTQNQREHYIKICKIVNGDVSAEVIATDYEGMIREGEELAARTDSGTGLLRLSESLLYQFWYKLRFLINHPSNNYVYENNKNNHHITSCRT